MRAASRSKMRPWISGTAVQRVSTGSDASDFLHQRRRQRAARFFRGVQPTDAKGRVDFDLLPRLVQQPHDSSTSRCASATLSS